MTNSEVGIEKYGDLISFLFFFQLLVRGNCTWLMRRILLTRDNCTWLLEKGFDSFLR